MFMGAAMRRFFLFMTVLLLARPAATSPLLTLTTEDYPPFNVANPQTRAITGISVDKVVELMRRAKQPYTLASYPWSRAYRMALQNNDTCVFSTTRIPEREALFKWVGPLVHNDWMVYARSDEVRQPKSLEALRPFVVGGYQNDAVGLFLKQQGFQVDFASYDEHNLQKLLYKRIDFWATGEQSGRYLIDKNGLNDAITPLFKFRKVDLYLACRLNMDNARIDAFNRILQEMERDGVSAAIERRYQ